MNFNCPAHGFQYGRNDCQYEPCVYNKSNQWSKEFLNKEHKMTREEAIKKCLNGLAMKPIELGDIKANQLVDMLEKLGLLKFSEEKEVWTIFELKDENRRFGGPPSADNVAKISNKYGVVRLEEWPEGLVLWIGGEIKWKSWKHYMEVRKVQGL